jgi:membrane protease YdiL (CAAX protease family)
VADQLLDHVRVRLPLVVPVLVGLAALINIATIDWRSPKARLLPLLVVGVALVGFAEELVTRGQLAVGLREGGAGELVVWLVTSALFGLLHGINALFGQSGRQTVVQVVAAFFAGTAFFVTVAATGTLVAAMVLHALWDLGTLGIQATGRQQRPAAGLLAGGPAAQPAQGRQLVAVAQAGIQVASGCGRLEPVWQLALPPVHAAQSGSDQPEGETQPEAGQPVLAQGQGGG